VADFDRDGRLDVAVSHSVSRFVSVLYGQGNVPPEMQFASQLRFALPRFRVPSALVVADFDGDGQQDLGLSAAAGGVFNVLLATGPRSFSQPHEFDLGDDPAKARTGGLAVLDLNNDGFLDVAATGASTDDVRVLLRKD
jgi:hypothetical protein